LVELLKSFVVEHNDIIIKEEPLSDGEMDVHPSHHGDESPTPFSFVSVKNEIVVCNICQVFVVYNWQGIVNFL
jgi:hypothetical protein